jgi:hypothetical protein
LFRHLDNAKNPVDICASAQDAWNIFTPVLLSGAQPIGPAAQTWSMDSRPLGVRWFGARTPRFLRTLQLGRGQHRPRAAGAARRAHLPDMQSCRRPSRTTHRVLLHGLFLGLPPRGLPAGRSTARFSGVSFGVEQGRE